MSTSTIARQPELSTPQDPWLHAVDTEYQPKVDSNGQQQKNAFHEIIASNFPEAAPIPHAIGDAAVAGVVHAPEQQAAPRHRRKVEHEYTPTPAAESERRKQANMMATLALAHTLRDAHPELLRDAEAAFYGPRPAAYKGRHRR